MSKKAGTANAAKQTSGNRGEDLAREPIFRLPPYTVHNIFVGLSEIQDWGLKLLNIPSLWRITEGEGVKVAILDTGVSLNHPDLTGSVPAGNFKDFTNSPHGIADQQGHGTHCAGIVAARKNSRGVVGVAPKAELLIGKVLGDDGSGMGENIAAGVNWAVEQGADIISMSLGAQVDIPIIHDAIKAGVEKGAFFICAAGNDSLNFVDYPGAYKETIAVGSINRRCQLSSFSSVGEEVTIVAPGEDVLSTYPPNAYVKLSGTSMATPFVAGVVALMLSKHRKFGGETPLDTQADVEKHLSMMAIDLGAPGFDPQFGWGLINPGSLLTRLKADGEIPC